MTFDTRRLAAIALAIIIGTSAAAAGELPSPGGWAALASDRSASRVGDSLTVLIYQNASASNTAQRGTRRASRVNGSARLDANDHTGDLSLGGTFDGAGQTSRSDQIAAAITVLVTDMLPNGDLRISGQQTLLVNGERTLIKVSGRVRSVDISGTNSVMSTRLADADIEYDAAGFGAKAARPGLISRALVGLGLF